MKDFRREGIRREGLSFIFNRESAPAVSKVRYGYMSSLDPWARTL